MRLITRITYDWAIRCFGREHVMDKRVRVLRLVEEAVELAQAVDIPREKLDDLIHIVYQRDRGDMHQELGGVLVTSAVLAAAMGWDPEQVWETELLRILNKPPEQFAKRNYEKMMI